MALMPEAFVATMPPIVHASALPGVVGNQKPCLPSSAFSVSYITPGSATQYRSSTRISLILFIAVRSSMIPPLSGTVCPHMAVPAPLGTIGVRVLFASLTISATCSAVAGLTTISGVLWWMDASKP